MTVPTGDMPDWQLQTSPQVQISYISNQLGGTDGLLFSQPSPFRIWAMWVRVSMSTSTAYVAAVNQARAQILDAVNNVLLEVAVHVTQANQTVNSFGSLVLPGFTTAPNAGTWRARLVTDSTPANIFYRASAGVYLSVP